MNNSINYIYELYNLFERKKWTNKVEYESVFESFSQLAIVLEEDFEIILELLENFHWITISDYYTYCLELLKDISQNVKDQRIFRLYIFPIIKSKHETEVKSGHFMVYLLKSLLPKIDNLKTLKLQELKSYEQMKKHKFSKNDLIILVDDFIGTGETLTACLNQIRPISYSRDQISITKLCKILTIAITNETYSKFNEIPIHYKFLEYKGISDYYSGKERNRKIETMIEVERRLIRNVSMYSLGYKKSESNLTLLRTPDNAFPIYWHKYKDNIKIKPPFERDE